MSSYIIIAVIIFNISKKDEGVILMENGHNMVATE